MNRILIAEDEPRLASFLEKGLRASGFTTTVVDDGPGAESLADESDFDLLILDLSLPGKDGLEVLRALRSAGSRLPVIILTARGDPHDRVEGLESGADDYLAKPFHFEELVARVRVQLRGGNRGSEETAAASRRRRARPAHPLGERRRRNGRAERARVRAAAHLPPAPEPGAEPRAVARPRMGL